MASQVLLQVLKHVWSTLEPLHLPMAVMGGIAVAAWKHLRATHDVDLLINLESQDLDTVMHRLEAAGLRPKCQPPVIDLGPVRLVQLLYEPPGVFVDMRIDLLLAESDYHRQALARRIPIQLEDLENLKIFVLSCEDVIIHKLIAGRIIDRADAAALLRANRASLDFKYLQEWIGRHGLTRDWLAIWDEAFPGEKPQVSS